MTDQDREKLVYKYVTGLDKGDFNRVEQVLEAAENDDELTRIILEVNQAMASESEAVFEATPDIDKDGMMKLAQFAIGLHIMPYAFRLFSGGVGEEPYSMN